MKLRWDELRSAESGWKLDGFKRGQILDQCLKGEKAGGFPWRLIGIPLAYAGAVAAMILVAILIWPLIRQPNSGKTVYIEGAGAESGAAPAPYVENAKTEESGSEMEEPSEEGEKAAAHNQKEELPAEKEEADHNLPPKQEEKEEQPDEEKGEPTLINLPAIERRYDYDDFIIDPGKNPVDEAAAIGLARQFLTDEFGAEKISLFSGVECKFYKSGVYDEGYYWISFYYPMGEDGYIHGPGPSVKISEYGGVMESYGCPELKNFDLNLLKGWSKAELKQKLMKQLTDRHGDKATDLTMESVHLSQGEQGTTLSITTDALIDYELSHNGHKSVSFTYCFETDSWEEPVYCE